MTAAHDPETDVEIGEEVAVRRKTGSALVAVRVPTELLRQIQQYATAQQVTVSDVLRTGAERLVRGHSAGAAMTRTYHFASSPGADAAWQASVRGATGSAGFEMTTSGSAERADTKEPQVAQVSRPA